MINSKIALSALSIVASLGLVTATAFAAFTATATNSNNTFGTGTLKLALNPDAGGVSQSTALFTVPSMIPGDMSSQKIALKNTGTLTDKTLTFRVNLNPLPTGITDLSPKLNISIVEDVAGDDTIAADGTVTDPGTADDVVIATATALSTLNSVAQPITGTLAAGATRNLIVSVKLDPATTNSFQGAQSSFNLNFDASSQ